MPPTVPLPPEAADEQNIDQAVLAQNVGARVRSLLTAAVIAVGAMALIGEMVLAGNGITVSAILRGAALAEVRNAADAVSTVSLIALLFALIVSRRRARISTLIIGVIAISAFHRAFAVMLVDYLWFPAMMIAITLGIGLIVRRACAKILSRFGPGAWPQARALFLLIAPPASICVAALLFASTLPQPSHPAYRWLPPPSPVGAPARVASKPPPGHYRNTSRQRRPARSPESIEAEIRRRLADNGFTNVGVSIDYAGRAYLSGSAADFVQKQEIEDVARAVPGVRGVLCSIEVPRGWLGVSIKAGAGGATVSYLAARGPADRAGIALNDVIVAIDGRPVANHSEFHDAMAAKAVGQTVTVTLVRDGETLDVPVTLAKNPSGRG